MNNSHYFKDNNDIQVKHVGSFTLLFFLSVLRPAALWPEIHIPMVPITLLVLAFLLLFKIHLTLGFKTFCLKYRTPLILIIIYQTLCLISLVVNRDRYADTTDFIHWGLILVVVQGALPTAVFLFLLPQNRSGLSFTRWRYNWILPLVIAALIPAVAIWQKIDNQSAFQFYQYFIAGNVGYSNNVRSILAISTDLGSVVAVVWFVLSLLAISFFQKEKKRIAFLLIFISLLNIIAGINSGARNFLLMSVIGILLWAFYFLRHNRASLVFALVILFLAGIAATQWMPTSVAYKLSNLAPLILPLNLGTQLIPSDFLPNVSIDVFGYDRLTLWQNALNQIRQNPLIGISNGGFRLLMESNGGSRVNNVHNALLQSAIDAGVLGTIIFISIVLDILKRTYKQPVGIIILICASGLLVDNFIEHSLPWIILVAFSIATINHQKNIRDEIKPSLIKRSLAIPAILCFVALMTAILVKYHSSRAKLIAAPTEKLIEIIYPIFSDSHWSNSPTIVSKNFINYSKFEAQKGLGTLFPIMHYPIPCHYSYPHSYFLGMINEISKNNSGHKIGSNWGIFKTSELPCDLTDETSMEPQDWISNNNRYFQRAGLMKDNTELRVMYGTPSVFSPIFKARSYEKITFNARGVKVRNVAPELIIELIDGDSGEVAYKKFTKVPRVETKIIIPTTSVANRAYVKLKLNNYQYDRATKEYHQIIIKNIKFE